MGILLLLIGASLLLAVSFLATFFWSVKSGQFEDTHTPSLRVLFDQEDDEYTSKPNPSTETLDARPSR